MYSDTRTNQGGSVAIFLLVSVMLAIAVIGGVYVAQKRGLDARAAQPIMEVTPESQSNKTPTPAQTEQQKQAAEKQKQQAEADKQAAAAKQAEELKKKQAQEAAQKQQAAANAQTPAAPTPQATVVPQTAHLPTTGPAENFAQVIAAGLIVAVVIAYFRSYKFRFGSYLK
jgi:outer membrane biosynthesis protein TonB